jgi:hypothetical protein
MFLLLLRVSCRKGNHQATVFASECQFVLYIYIYIYILKLIIATQVSRLIQDDIHIYIYIDFRVCGL